LLCDDCYATHVGMPCVHDRETKQNRELVG
ncbi:MAG: hypothetical protein RLZZ575_711, partial [Actinomycetota bacterium]